jgi:hypothetical protein
MDINIYDLKLREIDKKIDDWNKSAAGRAYQKCKDKQLAYNSIFIGGSIGASEYIDGTPYGCTTVETEYKKTIPPLVIKRAALIKEMEAEQQYLKDQYILQQQQATAFAEQQALKAAEEVRAAANKTEQELQIAKQKLAQANEALAKSKAAESLAKSVDTGNLEAGRVLMGINTVSKYKTPMIIGAVTLGVLALGFIGYKMLAKAKKV